MVTTIAGGSAWINTLTQTHTNPSAASKSFENIQNSKDSYVPSYDFAGTGAEFYTQHKNLDLNTENPNINIGLIRTSTSLDSFKQRVTAGIIDDYGKQNPNTFIRYENGTIGYAGTKPEALYSYLDNFDFEKEYQDYKTSRECKTDADLEALNSVDGMGTLFYTKSQLINTAKMTLKSRDMKDGLGTANVTLSDEEADKLIDNANIKDIAKFCKDAFFQPNFEVKASAFDALISSMTDSDKLDKEFKEKLATFHKNITDSHDAIKAYSKSLLALDTPPTGEEKAKANLIKKYAA